MNIYKAAREKIIYLIPALFIAIPLLFKVIYYPISDDYLLTSVLRGAYDGKPDADLRVINIILSSIWKELYSVFPNIDWYAATLIILILLNSYTIFYLLNKKMNKYISLAIVLSLELFMISWISFTVIAYYSAFTLGAFIFYYFKEKTSIYKPLIIIAIITFGGYCFRNNAFESGFIAVSPVLLLSINKKNIKKIIFSGVVVILIVSTCFITQNFFYSTDHNKKSSEWASARSQVGDYPISTYDDNKQLYDNIDFSKNDYLGLTRQGYYMADLDTYSTHNLKTIVEKTPRNIRYNTNLASILKNIAKIKEFWAFLIILVAAMYFRKTKKQILFSIIELLLVVGQCIYLIYIGRPGERIVIPLFYFSILSVIFYSFYNCKENKIGKIISIICIAIPLLLLVSYTKQIITVNNFYRERQQQNNEIEREIQNNKNNLYVINCSHHILMNKPIEIYRKPIFYRNILELSNYEVLFNDTYYNKVKEYNLTYKNNLLLDLAVDDNTLFIDYEGKNISHIEKYIQEHTEKQVKKKVIKVFNNSKTIIYKLGLGS